MWQLKQVSKSYGETQVLRDVNFTLHRGESVALMGPSGRGKSTILHIMGCLDTPTSGAYTMEGEEVASLDDLALSRLRGEKIGFVFQSHHLLPKLTLFQNVELPLLYRHPILSKSERRDRVEGLLERVGLSNRLYHYPKTLSGGESQRGAVARALVGSPSLLLADEPTGSLDAANRESLLTLFEELHSDGMTWLVATHDPEVARRCGRVWRL